MQKKPQMVEAVMFFSEGGIAKEMLLPEFEAVLDGVVNLPELADQQIRLAHVLINSRLQVQTCVFFYLDFDDSGAADPGWNLPLRRLADRGETGPDLGAGPIRLVCRSRCPVPWHQMHLWDPEPNDLLLLRDAVRRNQLGLLCEEELPPRTARSLTKEDARRGAADSDGERLKAARLIKRQRQHLQDLNREHSEALARLQLAADEREKRSQAEIRQLRAALCERQEVSASLEEQLQVKAESLEQAREALVRLAELEVSRRNELEAVSGQIQNEMEARVAELQRRIKLRDAKLSDLNDQKARMQEELDRLKEELALQATQGVERVLGQLAQQGMVFVVYHPGAGHLTIPLQDIARYLENPMAYAAAKCFVGEEQYRQWLSHFQQPTCEAVLPSGGRCALPIDRIDSPARFVSGESNCCSRHRAGNRLRNAS